MNSSLLKIEDCAKIVNKRIELLSADNTKEGISLLNIRFVERIFTWLRFLDSALHGIEETAVVDNFIKTTPLRHHKQTQIDTTITNHL